MNNLRILLLSIQKNAAKQELKAELVRPKRAFVI